MPRRAFCGIAALAALSLCGAASAAVQHYTVTFTGSGQYQSDYDNVTTRAYTLGGVDYTGSCIYHHHEDTHFQWSAAFPLAMSFGKRGVSSARSKGLPIVTVEPAKSTVVTDAHPGSDGDGCVEPNTAYSTAGNSDCTGHADPTGTEVLAVSAAPGDGKTRLDVNGPMFSGSGFDGTWTYYTGSCASSINGKPLALPDGPTFPYVLGAKFPVKTATWRSLPVRHWFRVKISQGHSAPKELFPLTCKGCHRELDWRGEVRIRRVK